MDREEVWLATDAERLSLAELLEQLPAQDWDRPSLCRDWLVRDVAAHVTMLSRLGPGSMLLAFARAGFGFDRMIHDTAKRLAKRTPAQLTADVRATAGSRKLPPGMTFVEPLLDILVHGQDIAVALGRRREMPPEAALVAAERAWSMGFPFHAQKKYPGVRLVATDLDWSVGSGPAEITGPIAAILLLLTGRDGALVQANRSAGSRAIEVVHQAR
ncbi:maleylpyruvate isomerase family mycothiol-dependent enzyme [Amycolatopsis nigrescens]|uniref:maleylpyruvate isomerase family mycothiol-dependent enzyme n=1 Tax=Amycolatopsis nigrescens TaxID=381445 RepID=UPI00036E9D26|nr:maleylpyruvate isomerase family mycothiol-dependent enzyme [Amycolatopsis nigrescens]